MLHLSRIYSEIRAIGVGDDHSQSSGSQSPSSEGRLRMLAFFFVGLRVLRFIFRVLYSCTVGYTVSRSTRFPTPPFTRPHSSPLASDPRGSFPLLARPLNISFFSPSLLPSLFSTSTTLPPTIPLFLITELCSPPSYTKGKYFRSLYRTTTSLC